MFVFKFDSKLSCACLIKFKPLHIADFILLSYLLLLSSLIGMFKVLSNIFVYHDQLTLFRSHEQP